MSEKNGYATPNAIFATPLKRRFTDKEIDGLGRFRIQTLTASEMIDLEGKTDSEAGRLLAPARVIIAQCVDGDGNRVFSDNDIKRIMGLDSAQVLELCTACTEHRERLAEGNEEKN